MADTGRQQRLIQALLTTETVREAAKTAKVPERTAHRWLAEDASFQQAFARARWQMVQQSIASVQRSSLAACLTLRALLDDTSPAIRLGAARTLLDFTLRSVELEQVVQRLDRLERLLEPPHVS
jgi:hypothetical protein